MAPLRDFVALSLRRRRSTLCLLLAAIVLLGLTESARGAPWKRTVRYKWVYTVDALLRFGPQYFQRPDSIRVYGLVRGGSQVNLEYLLNEEGALMVDIEFEGEEKKPPLRFPAEGPFPKRETQAIKLPADLGDEPKVAIFTFWREDRSGRQDASFDLTHLGIEYRPDDVAWMDSGTRLAMLAPGGSLDSAAPARRFWISDVEFGPCPPNGEAAYYKFMLQKNSINLAVHVRKKNEWKAVWQELPSCPPRKGETCEGEWDGLDRERRPSRGFHFVIVKTWTALNDPDSGSELRKSDQLEIPASCR